MLNDKMNALIEEVSGCLAEREELIHTLALALLTRKNLFVLGKPGQAKSLAIDLFRASTRSSFSDGWILPVSFRGTSPEVFWKTILSTGI